MMQDIDLFETHDGYWCLVPEDRTKVLVHARAQLADVTDTFALEARLLAEGEIVGQYPYQEMLPSLTNPDTVQIARYVRLKDDGDEVQDQISVHANPLHPAGKAYLGPMLMRLALDHPLPNTNCWRCVGEAKAIGMADIRHHRTGELQQTILHQCPSCGAIRQTGFVDKKDDWWGEHTQTRSWVRLLPDVFERNGRLRVTKESGGLRLNLDGFSIYTGQSFELCIDGQYYPGRLEVGMREEFYFVFADRTRRSSEILPGMRARFASK